MKITINTTVISFEPFDKDHNRLAVTTMAGVIDAFPTKDESGERLMHRLSGLVEVAQAKVTEYFTDPREKC